MNRTTTSKEWRPGTATMRSAGESRLGSPNPRFAFVPAITASHPRWCVHRCDGKIPCCCCLYSVVVSVARREDTGPLSVMRPVSRAAREAQLRTGSVVAASSYGLPAKLYPQRPATASPASPGYFGSSGLSVTGRGFSSPGSSSGALETTYSARSTVM
jgi:hypothetical protein